MKSYTWATGDTVNKAGETQPRPSGSDQSNGGGRGAVPSVVGGKGSKPEVVEKMADGNLTQLRK